MTYSAGKNSNYCSKLLKYLSLTCIKTPGFYGFYDKVMSSEADTPQWDAVDSSDEEFAHKCELVHRKER